jgi:hypothetical protein
MNHADPWDEVARLQKQMDVELLRELRGKQSDHSKRPETNERAPKDTSKH